jgi:uncharacterized protein YkwD
MSETVDVQPHRTPKRRPIWALTLAVVPLLVTATALTAAGQVPLATDNQAALVAPIDVPDFPVPNQTSSPVIVAPGTVDGTDFTKATQKIEVEFPPEPEPVKVAQPSTKQSTSTGTAPKSSGAKQSTSTKSTSTTTSTKKFPSYQAFCPTGAKYSVGGSTAKSMLSTLNNERARIGIKKLTWSSSLAGSATNWSKSMAAKDSKTPNSPANALTHNPNRPSGGENVGVAWSSNTLSASAGMSRVHSGFMKSNGHCENLMNPRWTRVGAGIAKASNGAWYITQNFQ